MVQFLAQDCWYECVICPWVEPAYSVFMGRRHVFLSLFYLLGIELKLSLEYGLGLRSDVVELQVWVRVRPLVKVIISFRIREEVRLHCG